MMVDSELVARVDDSLECLTDCGAHLRIREVAGHVLERVDDDVARLSPLRDRHEFAPVVVEVARQRSLPNAQALGEQFLVKRNDHAPERASSLPRPISRYVQHTTWRRTHG